MCLPTFSTLLLLFLFRTAGLFKNGKPGQIPVSFNKDQRKPLSDNLTSRTDAMYAPKLPPTRFTTFGKPSGNKTFSMKTPVRASVRTSCRL